MIDLRNVSARTESGLEILAPFNLQLEKGKILGIYGPNGSGKSTLLRAIAGVSKNKVVAGEIRIGNIQINSKILPKEKIKWVLYLGSDFYSHFKLNVSELLELGAGVMSRALCSANEAIDEVVEQLKIAQFLSRDFRSLSDGEKQLTMFARVLIQKPELMIFDESFSKLDLDKIILVSKALKDYASRGSAFMVASHDLNFLSECSDELLILKAGKSIAHGKASEILTPFVLKAVYPELDLQEIGRAHV